MENLINLRIEASEESLEHDPFILQNLERDIQREIESQILRETKLSPEGSMSGEIVSAMELAGLAVTTLGTIWTILKIHYRGQISFEKELADGTKITITKTNLTDKQVEEEISKLENEAKERKFIKIVLKLGGTS